MVRHAVTIKILVLLRFVGCESKAVAGIDGDRRPHFIGDSEVVHCLVLGIPGVQHVLALGDVAVAIQVLVVVSHFLHGKQDKAAIAGAVKSADEPVLPGAAQVVGDAGGRVKYMHHRIDGVAVPIEVCMTLAGLGDFDQGQCAAGPEITAGHAGHGLGQSFPGWWWLRCLCHKYESLNLVCLHHH